MRLWDHGTPSRAPHQGLAVAVRSDTGLEARRPSEADEMITFVDIFVIRSCRDPPSGACRRWAAVFVPGPSSDDQHSHRAASRCTGLSCGCVYGGAKLLLLASAASLQR